MKKRILVLLTVVALMVVMAVAPAFAQTGFLEFNDIQGVTFGGNCVVNDFVEICDINTGTGTGGL
jgi:hypothetical protein